jgi:hypothetical protein
MLQVALQHSTFVSGALDNIMHKVVPKYGFRLQEIFVGSVGCLFSTFVEYRFTPRTRMT